MATDAIITLEQLRCIRESDGTGHSEPYIWPALLWIDDNTLTTPTLVGVTTPVLGNARVVIKSDMRAGQVADIPTSVGMLRVRFEDGLTLRRIILAVALWEEDETPEAAMRAGFQAFSSELRAAVADNLLALSQASGEQLEALKTLIRNRVKSKVRSAIENGLTGWQKTRVMLGILNLDDFIESDVRDFPELSTTPIAITLAFRAGRSDAYEIQGNLQVRPVPVDRCQTEVNAVKDAQSVVDDIDSAIRALQTELQDASPGEKPFIISEIKRLREEELGVAIAVLEEARRALRACRNRKPPIRDLPDIADLADIVDASTARVTGTREFTGGVSFARAGSGTGSGSTVRCVSIPIFHTVVRECGEAGCPAHPGYEIRVEWKEVCWKE